MRPPFAFAVLALTLPLFCAAQDSSVIELKNEPHHHLVLQNNYVNVYSVQVAPHDVVLLHKHEVNAIGITINDAVITVASPGKPDSRQNVASGQLRLQPAGYIHSTTVEGDNPFRNVTVELILPQQNFHNVCATVMSAQPLSCPHLAAPGSEEVAFESDKTKVATIRLVPAQSVTVDHAGSPALIVALDDGTTSNAAADGDARLDKGHTMWGDAGAAPQVLTNHGAKAVRLVIFTFKPESAGK